MSGIKALKSSGHGHGKHGNSKPLTSSSTKSSSKSAALSKRADKLLKTKYNITNNEVCKQVLTKLHTSFVSFGAKMGRHFVVGFNEVMRGVERNEVDVVVLSMDAPVTVVQALYEAVAVRQRPAFQHKHAAAVSGGSSSAAASIATADTAPASVRSAVNLLLLPAKSSISMAQHLQLKRASCFALRTRDGGGDRGCSDSNSSGATVASLEQQKQQKQGVNERDDEHVLASLDELREAVLQHSAATFAAPASAPA